MEWVWGGKASNARGALGLTVLVMLFAVTALACPSATPEVPQGPLSGTFSLILGATLRISGCLFRVVCGALREQTLCSELCLPTGMSNAADPPVYSFDGGLGACPQLEMMGGL